jgi:hypothetical protein
LNRTKTFVAALALFIPFPAVIAACGGDDSSDEDPQEVLEATFSNEESLESGVLDLTLDFSAEGEQGGGLSANLNGPFVADPDDPTGIGELDLEVTASGEGTAAAAIPEDFSAGLTITEDNLYVSYEDQAYELGTEAFEQLKAQQEEASGGADAEGLGFKEACEQGIEAQGGDPAACDFDVTAWFSNLENEGTEDVGGSEATHIAGTLDVEQMVTDLFNLGASVPGATGGVDPALLEGQLGVISEAVSGAEFDVYSATEDDTLRGLDFALDLDTAALGGASAGVDSASLSFSMEISDVGEDQTIDAPDDAQPIEDLAGELGIPGLPGAGGGLGFPGGDSELPGAGGPGGGNLDPDCIAEAAGDPAEIQKCLE